MSRQLLPTALAVLMLAAVCFAQGTARDPVAASPLDQQITLELSGAEATVSAVLAALPPTLSLVYDSRILELGGFELKVRDVPVWQLLQAVALIVPELILHRPRDGLVVIGYEAVPHPTAVPPLLTLDPGQEEDRGGALDESWFDELPQITLADTYFESALSALDRGEVEVGRIMLRRAKRADPDREFKLEPRYRRLLDQAEGK